MEKARECELLGHGVTADYRPGFKYQARETCTGKISGCNQAIVSCAGYYYIELLCQLSLLSVDSTRKYCVLLRGLIFMRSSREVSCLWFIKCIIIQAVDNATKAAY